MKRILSPCAFALALALAASLTGCGLAASDELAANVYVFNNKTSATVILEACEGGEVRHSWTIEPGESLRQSASDGEYRAYANNAMSSADLYTHTSVFDFPGARMLFAGGTKELRFNAAAPHTPHNIFNRYNYRASALSATEVEWTYDIDPTVLSAATAATAAPEPAPAE